MASPFPTGFGVLLPNSVEATPAERAAAAASSGRTSQPTTPAPSISLSPTVTDVNAWLYFKLLGTNSPGTIPRGGVRGFKRETGWDIKAGKGTKGATLTLKSQPPCKGSFILQLIGPGGFYAWGGPSTDFAQWDAFAANVLSINPTIQQGLGGLAIYYPGFASIGLTAVVVAHYTGPEHIGRGMYHATIDLIEYCPPPPVSIVATPTSLKPDNPEAPGGPTPVDPRIAALQAAIAAANKASQP